MNKMLLLLFMAFPGYLFANNSNRCTIPEAKISALGETSICWDDSVHVTLSATTGTGYTYQWYLNGNIISGAKNVIYAASALGSYSALITNNGTGCSKMSDTITVTRLPTPPDPVITRKNDTLLSSGAVQYQWSLNGYQIPGATSQILITDKSGLYTVTITDSNGCSSVSQLFQYTSVHVQNLLAAADAYPNPFINGFTIKYTLLSQAFTSITISDMVGREIFKRYWVEQTPGTHEFYFDPLQYNLGGSSFILKIRCGEEEAVRQIMMVK